MFWKKGQEPESTRQTIGSSRPTAPPVEVLDPVAHTSTDDKASDAVETLAAVLRSFGRYAFDLDEVTQDDTAEAFEKWAMRLLIGETNDVAAPTTTARRPRGIQRDWGGVRRFVERHRKDEHDYVVTGMANLRQAVRVFIQCTTGSFRAERASEALVAEQLDALGKALAANDHTQIRLAAERTAQTVHQELEARRSREQRQIEALQDSMEKLRDELSQLQKEARTDGLTRVFNRTALDEHLVQVADHAFLSGQEACLVMVDIDYFKGINDNYGHQAGDEVLRQVADTIVRGFFRREDFVARYGGEEFCVVCQQTTFEATRDRAERLRQTVENLQVQAFGRSISVSVSFGIALLQRGETAQHWLQRADEALYRAKQKGRNCISTAPLGMGDALGGTGAPLGATLDMRGTERARRIMVSDERPGAAAGRSSGRAPKEQADRPAKTPSSHRIAANENAPPPRSKSKTGLRGKSGANQAPTSPIAALLGPSTRR